jgi:hypothetical protein
MSGWYRVETMVDIFLIPSNLLSTITQSLDVVQSPMLIVFFNNSHQNSNKNIKTSAATTIRIIKFLFVRVIPNSKVPTDDFYDNNNKNNINYVEKGTYFKLQR